MARPSRKNWRLIPLPGFMALMDILVTLWVQPEVYWNGAYSVAYNFNPVVQWALRISPFMAILGAVLWAVFLLVSMSCLASALCRFLFVVLVVGHGVCVGGWLVRSSSSWFPVFVTGFAVVFLVGFFQVVRNSRLNNS